MAIFTATVPFAHFVVSLHFIHFVFYSCYVTCFTPFRLLLPINCNSILDTQEKTTTQNDIFLPIRQRFDAFGLTLSKGVEQGRLSDCLKFEAVRLAICRVNNKADGGVRLRPANVYNKASNERLGRRVQLFVNTGER